MRHDAERLRRAGASAGAGHRDGTFTPHVDRMRDRHDQVVDTLVLLSGGAR